MPPAPPPADRAEPTPRTGGEILADQLIRHGAQAIFGVPGESYLPLLDALHDRAQALPFHSCRMEAGAANMAEAWGKLTGRPGICAVTRGPGAAHAAVGVHTAFQDSTPMILLVGQVARGMRGREAFQEVDMTAMFAPLAKWATEIDDPARLPEIVARAFVTAQAGRPGPVVLALPEDMLAACASVPDARPARPARSAPAAGDLDSLREMLAAAERPFALVGGSGWTAETRAQIAAFAQRFDLPVGAAFRWQGRFDPAHDSYAGDVGLGINPELARRLREADLILALGPRLGEVTSSGYSLLDIPTPRQRLVHVHPGPEEPGRVFQPDLGIAASMAETAPALAAMTPARPPGWGAWREAARAAYLAWSAPVPNPGPVQMAEIVTGLNERLPADAIITNGAGNYAGWLHRFFRYRRHDSQLAPTSGAMGYGVPAAIAAKIAAPERTVLGFAGDGCFLMTGEELATAVARRLGVIFVVVNNGLYGTIRMHQELSFPGRPVGTDLVNPDFVALAEAYGAAGARVTETAAFAPALEAALARTDRPSLIEIRLDPEAISPTATLSGLAAGA